MQANDQTVAELALIENLQRQDLNPLEEALGYQRLMHEYAMSQEAVAQCVGKSRPAVANALRLLQLPEAVAQMVKDGKLSAGHARAVLMLKSVAQQAQAAQKIAALDLSVRQAELLCKSMTKKTPAPPALPPLGGGLSGRVRKAAFKKAGPGRQNCQWKAQGPL